MSLPSYVDTHRTDTVRKYFWLLKIECPTPQYLTDCDVALTYLGNSYSPTRGVVIPGYQETDQKAIEVDSISIGNGDAAFGVIVQALTGVNRNPRVTLYEVWLDATTADTTIQAGRTLFAGVLDSPEWDSEHVAFTVRPDGDSDAVTLPSTMFQTDCTWRDFKGPGCGYTGSETSCDRSIARCTVLANTDRFRGFRGLPLPGMVLVFLGNEYEIQERS